MEQELQLVVKAASLEIELLPGKEGFLDYFHLKCALYGICP
jgi:hypothetical protein